MVKIFIYSEEENITDVLNYDSYFIPIVGDYILWGGEEHKVVKRVARVNSSGVNIHVRRY
jgi:hypothetical protein